MQQPTPSTATLQLREALRQFAGMTITPELALAIERATFYAPDRSIDPQRFGTLEHQGFVIQAERMSDILEELHPLHQAHWQETEKHRLGLPLRPDYDFMLARERAGELIQFAVRRAGELVGNLRMYLGLSRHTGTLFAEEDTLYLAPKVRGGMTAISLMRFAERSLRAVGAREIRADSKLINNADVLMRRLGYQPVATKFVKVFKEHDDVQ